MSGKKNTYLQRQRTAQQTVLEIGEKMGMQKMWDYVQLALTNPEVMSTHVVPKERMEKVFAELGKLADEYHTAFTDDKEADYYQEKLDAHLREVWGDELNTFYERYPYIKQIDYSKPRKNWR